MRMKTKQLILFWLVAQTAFLPSSFASSKRMKADNEVHQLTVACRAFQEEYGAYPSETNWLEELTAQPTSTLNTNELVFIETPLLYDAQGKKRPPHDFLDPWQHPYVYHYPGRWNANGPDIYSMGSDEKTATSGNDKDDINNWNKDKPWRRYYNRQPFFVPITVACVAIVLAVVGVWLACRRYASTPKVMRLLPYVPMTMAVLSLALYGLYEFNDQCHALILERCGCWLSLSGLLIGLVLSRTIPNRKVVLLTGTVLSVIAAICCWLLTSV